MPNNLRIKNVNPFPIFNLKTSLKMKEACPRMCFQVLGQKVMHNLSIVNSSYSQNFLLPNINWVIQATKAKMP